jgi:hypothetical protein
MHAPIIVFSFPNQDQPLFRPTSFVTTAPLECSLLSVELQPDFCAIAATGEWTRDVRVPAPRLERPDTRSLV